MYLSKRNLLKYGANGMMRERVWRDLCIIIIIIVVGNRIATTTIHTQISQHQRLCMLQNSAISCARWKGNVIAFQSETKKQKKRKVREEWRGGKGKKILFFMFLFPHTHTHSRSSFPYLRNLMNVNIHVTTNIVLIAL